MNCNIGAGAFAKRSANKSVTGRKEENREIARPCRSADQKICATLVVVAAPDPDECVGQGLLEDATVTVARSKREDEAVMVTLGPKRSRGAVAGHDPVVMGFLRIARAQIVF